MHLGVSRVDSLKELLSLSDCVSLHCTYNEKNRHMLNDSAFSYMHSGFLWLLLHVIQIKYCNLCCYLFSRD